MQRAISRSLVTAATETTSTARGGQPLSSISRNSDNFPTLAQQTAMAQGMASTDSHGATMADKLALASNLSVQGGRQAQDDFPSLGGAQRGGRRPITAPVGKAWSSKQPPVKSHVVAVVPNTNKQKSEPQKIPKPLPQKQMRSAIAWDAPGPKPAQVEGASVRRPTGPRVTSSVTTGKDFPSLSSIGNSLMSSRPVASAPVRSSTALAAYEVRESNKRAGSAADVKRRDNDSTTANSSVSSKKNDTTNKGNNAVNKKNDAVNKTNDAANKKNDAVNKKNDAVSKTNDATSKKNDAVNKKNDMANKKGEHRNDVTNTDNATKPKHEPNDSKLELGSKGDTSTSTKKSDIKQDAVTVKKRDGNTNRKADPTSIHDTNGRRHTVAAPVNSRKSGAAAPDTTRMITKSSDRDFPVLGASECHDGASWLTKTSSKHDMSKPSGKVDKSQKSEQRPNKSASWTNAAVTSHDDFPSLKQASLASVVVGGTQQNVEETDEFTLIKGAKGKKKNKQVMEDLCRKHKFVVKVDLPDSDEEESDESMARLASCELRPGVNKRQKGKQDSDDPVSIDRKQQTGDVVTSKTIAPTSLKDCADSVTRQPVASRAGSDVKVAPPPGFAQPPKTKAPPGFNTGSVSSSVSVPLPNGNLGGRTDDDPVNGHDSQALPPRDYIQPENFTTRNHKLIQDIQTLLDYGGDDKFGEFKTCSKEFRRGEISGAEYHDCCITIMGKECFDEVFAELVVLLPVINKQQELLDAHYGTKKRGKSGRRGARTSVPCGTINTKSKFYACRVCRQVLMTKERDAHLRHHDTDADFPTLQPAGGCGLYGMGSAAGLQNLAS